MKVGSASNLSTLHAWLLAATVYVGAHDGATLYAVPHSHGPLLTLLIVVIAGANAAIWFGWTRRLGTGANGIASRSLSPLLLVPVGYFTLLSFVTTLQDHGSLLAWAGEAAGYGLTFLITAELFAATWDARPLFYALAFAGAAICLEGLICLVARVDDPSMLLAFPKFFRASDRPEVGLRLGGDLLPYPTMLVSLLNVFAAVALGLWTTAKTKQERAIWVAAYGLFAFCALLTASRAGVIFLVLMTLAHYAYHSARRRQAALTGAGVILGGVLLLLLKAPGGFLRGDGSLRSRFHMWRVCLRIIRAHPLLGGGPGAFPAAWAAYAPAYGYPLYVVPHNLYIGLLAEGGLLLFGMALLLLVGVVREIQAVLRSSARPESRQLLFALALGLGTTLVHDLLETPFRMRSMYLLACLLVGLTVGMRRRAQT